MCFCTSCIFWVKLDTGFSVPSTTLVCSAWYTSEKAITCGIAPSERTSSSSTFGRLDAQLHALEVSRFFSGLLAENCLKPLSQKARP